jgi:hypothetical protein
MTHRLSELVGGVDWADCASIYAAGERVKNHLLADGGSVLMALLDRFESSEALHARCEAFEIFSKLMLHQEGPVKLRLHFFDSPVWEAHNHRAPFYCYMLSGSYMHSTYGFSDPAAGRLKAGHCHEQRAGTAYAITHDYVHSTIAQEPSVSLFLQGPAMQDSLVIASLRSGAVRKRHGSAAVAGPQEPGERRLQPHEIAELSGRARQAVREHLRTLQRHA